MGRDSLPDRSVFRPGTIAADPLTLTLSPEGERGLAPPLLHFLLPSRLREGRGRVDGIGHSDDASFRRRANCRSRAGAIRWTGGIGPP